MNISTFIFLIIMIAAVFFVYKTGVDEANVQYEGTNFNSSAWDTKYDYSDKVNSSVAKIETKFRTIQDPDAGFFSKIAAGLTAIPYGVILVPMVTIDSLGIGGSIVVDSFGALGIPSKLITLTLIGLMIFGAFRLVKFWQREPI